MSASEEISRKTRKKKRVKKTARRSRKDLGLLHGTRAVAIEKVTSRMKKPCRHCGGVIQSERRLLVKEGAGRYAKTHPYCESCGEEWLLDRWMEYDRAIAFLKWGRIPRHKRRTDLEDEGIRDV